MNEHKKKILIIEDDDGVSRLYDIKLSHEGYDIVLAKNGEEALEKTLNERPDLIMLTPCLASFLPTPIRPDIDRRSAPP